MLIGISGKKQSGKDTIYKIIRLVDHAIYKSGHDVAFMSKKHIVDEIVESLELGEQREYGTIEKRAFAGKLKEAASIILRESPLVFENEKSKNWPTKIGLVGSDGSQITNRKFLQLFGTEVGRAIDPDIWVKALMAEYDAGCFQNVEYGQTESGETVPIGVTSYEPRWCITDVRFPNEAEAIKARNGILIRVNRNTGVVDNHASETALDDYGKFNYTIDNNGSLLDLVSGVFDIVLSI